MSSKNYPTPIGEKYMNIPTMITTTINERITSHEFQLARERALSSATVVAYVSPFNCSSEGFSVNKLTITMTAMLNKNKRIQKYRKLIVANEYRNPESDPLFNSNTIRKAPIMNPTVMAVMAPFALRR